MSEDEERAGGLMFLPLRELLGSADVLILHVPPTAGIRLLIGEPTLRFLQPHA